MHTAACGGADPCVRAQKNPQSLSLFPVSHNVLTCPVQPFVLPVPITYRFPHVLPFLLVSPISLFIQSPNSGPASLRNPSRLDSAGSQHLPACHRPAFYYATMHTRSRAIPAGTQWRCLHRWGKGGAAARRPGPARLPTHACGGRSAQDLGARRADTAATPVGLYLGFWQAHESATPPPPVPQTLGETWERPSFPAYKCVRDIRPPSKHCRWLPSPTSLVPSNGAPQASRRPHQGLSLSG